MSSRTTLHSSDRYSPHNNQNYEPENCFPINNHKFYSWNSVLFEIYVNNDNKLIYKCMILKPQVNGYVLIA